MNNKLHDEKCFIFIDESHEASIESLEWLRSITDQTENLYILLAGLPTLEKMLKENLQSFLQRIGTRIELSNLTKAETKELIKRRIENSGGNNTDPFTSEAIDFIYRKTGGFPREVLRLCNDLSLKAHEKHISTIDSDLIKEMKEPAKRVSLETVKELPERQQMILDILSSKGELTPPEIVKNMKSSEYKNKGNALRAVNNLLKRLMNDGFVERKRRGKTYKYLVSEKFQSLMVDT